LSRELSGRSREYLLSLLRRLLEEPDAYFSNGYLNSEGWKVLNLIRRLVVRSYPYLARGFKKSIYTGSYDEVVKVLHDLVNYVHERNSDHS
jgi:hypothetical protein